MMWPAFTRSGSRLCWTTAPSANGNRAKRRTGALFMLGATNGLTTRRPGPSSPMSSAQAHRSRMRFCVSGLTAIRARLFGTWTNRLLGFCAFATTGPASASGLPMNFLLFYRQLGAGRWTKPGTRLPSAIAACRGSTCCAGCNSQGCTGPSHRWTAQTLLKITTYRIAQPARWLTDGMQCKRQRDGRRALRRWS